MSLDIYTDCQCHCLAAQLFSTQTQMTVDGVSGWPDLNDPQLAGRTFLLQLKNRSSCQIETVRVTAMAGNVLTIDRAVGYDQVAFDFCVGDEVCMPFGATLSEGLNEIIDCIIGITPPDNDCNCIVQPLDENTSCIAH